MSGEIVLITQPTVLTILRARSQPALLAQGITRTPSSDRFVPNPADQLAALPAQRTVLLAFDLRRRGIPPVLRDRPPDVLDAWAVFGPVLSPP
jgi:hypothetical protein